MNVLHMPLAQSTPFVGREEELARLGALLDDPAVRLITVIGPGGIGKTRLAVEVASRVTRAVEPCFVSLESCSAPDGIVPAVAQAAVETVDLHGSDPDRNSARGEETS